MLRLVLVRSRPALLACSFVKLFRRFCLVLVLSFVANGVLVCLIGIVFFQSLTVMGHRLFVLLRALNISPVLNLPSSFMCFLFHGMCVVSVFRHLFLLLSLSRLSPLILFPRICLLNFVPPFLRCS